MSRPKFKVGWVVRLRDNKNDYRRITRIELIKEADDKLWLYHFAGDSWSLLESQLRPLTAREKEGPRRK